MLSYCFSYHMEQKLPPMLFRDDDKEAVLTKRTSPVAPTLKNKYQQQLQTSGKSFYDKVLPFGRIVQALDEAERRGSDLRTAIESVIPWDDLLIKGTETLKLKSSLFTPTSR